MLTTKTLSLFYDAKDNRILPTGWAPTSNFTQSDSSFGLSLIKMANITAPSDKVPGSQLKNDPYYSNKDLTGQDQVIYKIKLSDITGETPSSVRAIMHYQTIPPYFLVDRFNEGQTNGGGSFGSATERLIYLTSRLRTNLNLKSSNTTGSIFQTIQNWTMTLSMDSKPIPEN